MLPELGMVPWSGLNAHVGIAELEVTEQKDNSNSSTPCAGLHPEHAEYCAQGIGITGMEREGKWLT